MHCLLILLMKLYQRQASQGHIIYTQSFFLLCFIDIDCFNCHKHETYINDIAQFVVFINTISKDIIADKSIGIRLQIANKALCSQGL